MPHHTNYILYQLLIIWVLLCNSYNTNIRMIHFIFLKKKEKGLRDFNIRYKQDYLSQHMISTHKINMDTWSSTSSHVVHLQFNCTSFHLHDTAPLHSHNDYWVLFDEVQHTMMAFTCSVLSRETGVSSLRKGSNKWQPDNWFSKPKKLAVFLEDGGNTFIRPFPAVFNERGSGPDVKILPARSSVVSIYLRVLMC